MPAPPVESVFQNALVPFHVPTTVEKPAVVPSTSQEVVACADDVIAGVSIAAPHKQSSDVANQIAALLVVMIFMA